MTPRRQGRVALGVALCWMALGALGLARGSESGDAQSALEAAISKAKAERKIVLVEFGASYCGWCRNFAQFFRSEPTKKVVDSHFVVVELAVQEPDGRSTPGADELLKSWGGADSGLPFLAFVSSSGNKVADSNAMPGGGNIGYPVDPDEIEAFMGVLDRAGARLSEAERSTLVAYLQKTPEKR